jgi:hypothetical protein
MFLKPGFRDEFEDNLTRFVNTVIRGWIVNGNAELGLPVLDPLEVWTFTIDLHQPSLV